MTVINFGLYHCVNHLYWVDIVGLHPHSFFPEAHLSNNASVGSQFADFCVKRASLAVQLAMDISACAHINQKLRMDVNVSGHFRSTPLFMSK